MTYEYPLSWPPGFPRTKYPAQSRFETPEERVKRNLEFQLDLMDATNVVVTTNSELRRDGRPTPTSALRDTGVAVYFTRKSREQAIACDKWDSIRDNLQAVAKTIEALRGIDRWGTGEMVDAAFQGFTAIPASASAGIQVRPKRRWYEVLGVSLDAPREVIEAAGKAMQRKTHPDAGGSDADFQDVQDAIGEAPYGRAQAARLRRRRISTNEPMASPPNTMAEMATPVLPMLSSPCVVAAKRWLPAGRGIIFLRLKYPCQGGRGEDFQGAGVDQGIARTVDVRAS